MASFFNDAEQNAAQAVMNTPTPLSAPNDHAKEELSASREAHVEGGAFPLTSVADSTEEENRSVQENGMAPPASVDDTQHLFRSPPQSINAADSTATLQSAQTGGDVDGVSHNTQPPQRDNTEGSVTGAPDEDHASASHGTDPFTKPVAASDLPPLSQLTRTSLDGVRRSLDHVRDVHNYPTDDSAPLRHSSTHDVAGAVESGTSAFDEEGNNTNQTNANTVDAAAEGCSGEPRACPRSGAHGHSSSSISNSIHNSVRSSTNSGIGALVFTLPATAEERQPTLSVDTSPVRLGNSPISRQTTLTGPSEPCSGLRAGTECEQGSSGHLPAAAAAVALSSSSSHHYHHHVRPVLGEEGGDAAKMRRESTQRESDRTTSPSGSSSDRQSTQVPEDASRHTRHRSVSPQPNVVDALVATQLSLWPSAPGDSGDCDVRADPGTQKWHASENSSSSTPGRRSDVTACNAAESRTMTTDLTSRSPFAVGLEQISRQLEEQCKVDEYDEDALQQAAQLDLLRFQLPRTPSPPGDEELTGLQESAFRSEDPSATVLAAASAEGGVATVSVPELFTTAVARIGGGGSGAAATTVGIIGSTPQQHSFASFSHLSPALSPVLMPVQPLPPTSQSSHLQRPLPPHALPAEKARSGSSSGGSGVRQFPTAAAARMVPSSCTSHGGKQAVGATPGSSLSAAAAAASSSGRLSLSGLPVGSPFSNLSVTGPAMYAENSMGSAYGYTIAASSGTYTTASVLHPSGSLAMERSSPGTFSNMTPRVGMSAAGGRSHRDTSPSGVSVFGTPQLTATSHQTTPAELPSNLMPSVANAAAYAANPEHTTQTSSPVASPFPPSTPSVGTVGTDGAVREDSRAIGRGSGSGSRGSGVHSRGGSSFFTPSAPRSLTTAEAASVAWPSVQRASSSGPSAAAGGGVATTATTGGALRHDQSGTTSSPACSPVSVGVGMGAEAMVLSPSLSLPGLQAASQPSFGQLPSMMMVPSGQQQQEAQSSQTRQQSGSHEPTDAAGLPASISYGSFLTEAGAAAAAAAAAAAMQMGGAGLPHSGSNLFLSGGWTAATAGAAAPAAAAAVGGGAIVPSESFPTFLVNESGQYTPVYLTAELSLPHASSYQGSASFHPFGTPVPSGVFMMPPTQSLPSSSVAATMVPDASGQFGSAAAASVSAALPALTVTGPPSGGGRGGNNSKRGSSARPSSATTAGAVVAQEGAGKDEPTSAVTASGGETGPATRRNMYLTNLPLDWNTQRLVQACSCFGPILSAKVVHRDDTNKSRGYGFVLFEREEDAAKCLVGMDGLVVSTESGGSKQVNCRYAHYSAIPAFAEAGGSGGSGGGGGAAEKAPTSTASGGGAGGLASSGRRSGPEGELSHTRSSTTGPVAGVNVALSLEAAAAQSSGCVSGNSFFFSATPSLPPCTATTTAGVAPLGTFPSFSTLPATIASSAEHLPSLNTAGESRASAAGQHHSGVFSTTEAAVPTTTGTMHNASHPPPPPPPPPPYGMAAAAATTATMMCTMPVAASHAALANVTPAGVGVCPVEAMGAPLMTAPVVAAAAVKNSGTGGLAVAGATSTMTAIPASVLEAGAAATAARLSAAAKALAAASDDSDDDDDQPATRQEESAESRNNLYIANLPLDWNTQRLMQVCQPFGEIVSATVRHSPETNVSLGCGFVYFRDEESARLCKEALDLARQRGEWSVCCRYARSKATPPMVLEDAAKRTALEKAAAATGSPAYEAVPNAPVRPAATMKTIVGTGAAGGGRGGRRGGGEASAPSAAFRKSSERRGKESRTQAHQPRRSESYKSQGSSVFSSINDVDSVNSHASGDVHSVSRGKMRGSRSGTPVQPPGTTGVAGNARPSSSHPSSAPREASRQSRRSKRASSPSSSSSVASSPLTRGTATTAASVPALHSADLARVPSTVSSVVVVVDDGRVHMPTEVFALFQERAREVCSGFVQRKAAWSSELVEEDYPVTVGRPSPDAQVRSMMERCVVYGAYIPPSGAAAAAAARRGGGGGAGRTPSPAAVGAGEAKSGTPGPVREPVTPPPSTGMGSTDSVLDFPWPNSVLKTGQVSMKPHDVPSVLGGGSGGGGAHSQEGTVSNPCYYCYRVFTNEADASTFLSMVTERVGAGTTAGGGGGGGAQMATVSSAEEQASHGSTTATFPPRFCRQSEVLTSAMPTSRLSVASEPFEGRYATEAPPRTNSHKRSSRRRQQTAQEQQQQQQRQQQQRRQSHPAGVHKPRSRSSSEVSGGAGVPYVHHMSLPSPLAEHASSPLSRPQPQHHTHQSDSGTSLSSASFTGMGRAASPLSTEQDTGFVVTAGPEPPATMTASPNSVLLSGGGGGGGESGSGSGAFILSPGTIIAGHTVLPPTRYTGSGRGGGGDGGGSTMHTAGDSSPLPPPPPPPSYGSVAVNCPPTQLPLTGHPTTSSAVYGVAMSSFTTEFSSTSTVPFVSYSGTFQNTASGTFLPPSYTARDRQVSTATLSVSPSMATVSGSTTTAVGQGFQGNAESGAVNLEAAGSATTLSGTFSLFNPQ